MNSTIISWFELVMILMSGVALGMFIYQLQRRIGAALCFFSLLLFIAGFVMEAVLSGMEKDRLSYSNAVIFIMAGYLAVEVVLLVLTVKKRKNRLGKDTIREALDKSDIGLCYFDDSGRVYLCNECMHEFSYLYYGVRVLNGTELLERLKEDWAETGQPDTMEISLGERTYYVIVNKMLLENQPMNELKCVDVTDIHFKMRELSKENEKLKEMNEHLISYGNIADQVIREQEILNAKISVHDRFGRLLLTTKKAIEQGDSDEQLDVIINNLRETLINLRPEENISEKDDYYSELQKAALSAKVHIHIDGAMPEDSTSRELVFLAVRESISNLVRHADGHNLYVDIKNDEKTNILIKGDGNKKPGPVILGTGLSGLKAKIEKNGGIMNVRNEEEFLINISL